MKEMMDADVEGGRSGAMDRWREGTGGRGGEMKVQVKKERNVTIKRWR